MKEFINTNKNFEGFKVIKKKIFVNFVSKNTKLPNQGWKIHVSSSSLNYEKVLQKVFNYCLKNNLHFKFINNIKNLDFMFSKMFDRIQCGKLITIYSLDENTFKKIILYLSKILKNYNECPSILTDIRYKNSCIFYRYGSFYDDFILDDKGNKIKDERKPFPSIPNFVFDPFFKENQLYKKETKPDFKLNERYLVKGAIHFSNFGGLYWAIDETNNNKVLLKEYKPFRYLNEYWTSIKLGENEKNQLIDFKDSQLTPKLIDSFYYEDHFFVVREILNGFNLDELLGEYALFLVDESDSLKVQKAKEFSLFILIKFLEFFLECKKLNKIPLDLKLDNFIYCKDKHCLVFFDLENIHDINSYFKEKPYFINNSWLSINNLYKNYFGVQKKIAMMFISFVCKSNSFLYFNKSFKKTFEKFKLVCAYFKMPNFIVDTVYELYTNKNIDIETTLDNLKNFSFEDEYVVYEYQDLLDFEDKNFTCEKIKVAFDELKQYLVKLPDNKLKTIDKLILNNVILNNEFHKEINLNSLTWFEIYLIKDKIPNNFKDYLNLQYRNNELNLDVNLENKTTNEIFKILLIKICLLKEKIIVNNKENLSAIYETFINFEKAFFIYQKDNSYYVKNKNLKNNKFFYSPHLSNGIAAIIVLLLEFYDLCENKNEIKNLIAKYINSLTYCFLMKVAFLNGIAGFAYVLTKYSKKFSTDKFNKKINLMFNLIQFAQLKSKNSITYTDMYMTLKNDLNGKIGILLAMSEFLKM